MFFLVIGRYDKIGRDWLVEWLVALPKPCGVLAWTDLLAREILDACREDPKRLKAIFLERYGMNMREWRNQHRK